MRNYDETTDEELIRELRNGNQEITDFIMEKYKYLVLTKARALFLIGGDNDDLIQEGMIGLFKAIRDFNLQKEASFYSFALLCITRQLYTAIEASNRKKHTPLNTYISLSSEIYEEGERAGSFLDYLLTQDGNPEELLIHQENRRHMEEVLKKSLSSFESQVLKYYLNGKDYHQIAELMGKAPKSIDNALQRIRKKISVEEFVKSC